MEEERIYWMGNKCYKQVKDGIFWRTKEEVKPTAAKFAKGEKEE
jgi:hypothetical protein